MTTPTEKKHGKLIHVARIFDQGQWRLIFLRKDAHEHFTWYQIQNDFQDEVDTSVTAQNEEEALRLAARHWKHQSFTTVICGFRYTLPERDEHGINALFHQMIASYSSGNGIYYDDELGNNCFVQSASEEALNLWQQLKSKNRL